MSQPTLKEKKKIPNLFGMTFVKKETKRGVKVNFKDYMYVDYRENLPKRAKTNVFLPDLKGDWYESIQGWPVHAKVVDEGDDYIEIVGDKWEIFTDIRLVGDTQIAHRTTKTPLGVYEEDHKFSIEGDEEAIKMALHSLGWGFPPGFIPDEFRIAKKFTPRPINI